MGIQSHYWLGILLFVPCLVAIVFAGCIEPEILFTTLGQMLLGAWVLPYLVFAALALYSGWGYNARAIARQLWFYPFGIVMVYVVLHGIYFASQNAVSELGDEGTMIMLGGVFVASIITTLAGLIVTWGMVKLGLLHLVAPKEKAPE